MLKVGDTYTSKVETSITAEADVVVTGGGTVGCVPLRLYSWVVDVIQESEELKTLVLESKSGRQAIIGQATGAATAMSVKQNVKLRNLSTDELRKKLKSHGDVL